MKKLLSLVVLAFGLPASMPAFAADGAVYSCSDVYTRSGAFLEDAPYYNVVCYTNAPNSCELTALDHWTNQLTRTPLRFVEVKDGITTYGENSGRITVTINDAARSAFVQVNDSGAGETHTVCHAP